MTTEQDIKWEGQYFWVLHNRQVKRFEVLRHNGTHSLLVGHGLDEAKAIRTAQRLERYPECFYRGMTA